MRITSVDVSEYCVGYAHDVGVYAMSDGGAAARHPSAVTRAGTDEGIGWKEFCPNWSTVSTSSCERERPVLGVTLDVASLGDPSSPSWRILHSSPRAHDTFTTITG